MLDNKFTETMQRWLSADNTSRSLQEGAELLLRLNRNKWMYQQILRTRNTSKLEYELKKHLSIRLEGLTLQEVAEMERRVLPQAAATIEEGAPVITTDADRASGRHAGKRPDHDSLPPEIRAIYERNGDIYFKLKQTFETLKQMADAQPCDRHEHLKMLAELDRQYRENWAIYDSFMVEEAPAVKPEADGTTDSDVSPQKVQAARKYLSENRPKLSRAVEAGDEKKASSLRVKMQERVAFLRTAGQTFDADFRTALSALGLDFGETPS